MSQDVEESAYMGLLRPVLEYGSSVWNPQSILKQDEFEKKKGQLDSWLAIYTYETGSMTGILEQLKWKSPKKRRKDCNLIIGWLVVSGLTALWDSISVCIGPSPREREKEERKDRRE